ncbi:MAG: GDSL-type esterase/lipase family protein [Opitutaceae bacterium]
MTTASFGVGGLGFALLLAVAGAARAAESLRVACLGDSITHGARVKPATESYPARLQERLGPDFVVRNFGVSGATMWHGGRPSAFAQLPRATEFAPHVVIVMFGVNDTRSEGVDYWDHFDEFETDARKLIDTLLDLPTRPRVLLCTATAHVSDLPGMKPERSASVALRSPRLLEVRAKLQAVARTYAESGVELVDLYAVTAARRDGFDSDGVHLNPAGYSLLAETLLPRVRAAALKSAVR